MISPSILERVTPFPAWLFATRCLIPGQAFLGIGTGRHSWNLTAEYLADKGTDASPNRRPCQRSDIQRVGWDGSARPAGKPGLEILRERMGQMVSDVLDQAGAAELRQGAGQQEFDRHVD